VKNHNLFVIEGMSECKHCFVLQCPESGRAIAVYTDKDEVLKAAEHFGNVQVVAVPFDCDTDYIESVLEIYKKEAFEEYLQKPSKSSSEMIMKHYLKQHKSKTATNDEACETFN
jgi:hypothetical protein